jgi:hypothetical protein
VISTAPTVSQQQPQQQQLCMPKDPAAPRTTTTTAAAAAATTTTTLSAAAPPAAQQQQQQQQQQQAMGEWAQLQRLPQLHVSVHSIEHGEAIEPAQSLSPLHIPQQVSEPAIGVRSVMPWYYVMCHVSGLADTAEQAVPPGTVCLSCQLWLLASCLP